MGTTIINNADDLKRYLEEKKKKDSAGSPDDKSKYRKALEQGAALFNRGEYRLADPYLRTAARLNPKCAKSHLLLGAIALQTSREKKDAAGLGKAVEDIHKAMEMDKTDPEAHYHLGVGYELQGRPAKARQCYDMALFFDPAHQEAKEAVKRMTKRR